MTCASPLMERPTELKPLSHFLSNVLRNGTLTLEQIVALNALPTPHMQFEAVMMLQQTPGIAMADVLQAARTQAPCKIEESPSNLQLLMASKRWIDVAVLGLAIPLIHGFWGHRAPIGAALSGFMNGGVAQAQAARMMAPATMTTFNNAQIQEPIFITGKSRAKPAAAKPEITAGVRVDLSELQSGRDLEPAHLIDQSSEATETAAADLAAAEAMPITSRR